MTKYRLLSSAELHELEKEFIDYLILNGIEAKDWEMLKRDKKQDAEKVIELFSDVVFEKILRNTRYLEWRSRKDIKSLHCLKDRFVVVGMDLSNIKGADLFDQKYLDLALTDPPAGIQAYHTEIKYQKSRELEIFALIDKGFVISDGSLFKTLSVMLAQ